MGGTHAREVVRKRNWAHWLLALTAIAVFIGFGVRRELDLLAIKPLGQFLIEDFTYYARAFHDAALFSDPYRVREIGEAFIYPPQALVLLAPEFLLEAVSPWAIVPVNVALAIALPLLVAHLFQLPLRKIWWWPFVAVFFAPTLELIHIGQVNLLVCLGLALVLHRRAVVAGAGLAFAILLKFTPAVFLAYVVAARKGRVALWAAVWALLPTGVVLAWLGTHVFSDFADVIRDLLSATPTALSAGGRVARILGFTGATWPQTFLVGWCAVVLALSVIVAIRRGEGLPTYLIVGFLLPVTPSILWFHHFVFLLLPTFVWMAAKRDIRVTVWALMWLMLIQVDPTYLAAHTYAHLSAIVILIGQLRGDPVGRSPRSDGARKKPLADIVRQPATE